MNVRSQSSQEDQHRRIQIDGIPLTLTEADEHSVEWIGSPFLKQQLKAAWLRTSASDAPMSPRIIGSPGLGKTTLCCAVANESERPVYIFQCTMDTRPEDLLVTPVLTEGGKVEYRASPLLTGVIRGGVVILDEGNRMNERAWASLAPLLDDRRYVQSIIAGLKIPAHPEFRLATTMNDDASTFELPGYIQSRLRPRIDMPWPDERTEELILEANLPHIDAKVIHEVVILLQQAHRKGGVLTPRDGISIARYAQRLVSTGLPLEKAIRIAHATVADDRG